MSSIIRTKRYACFVKESLYLPHKRQRKTSQGTISYAGESKGNRGGGCNMNMDDLQKSRYKRRGSPQWGVSGGALRNLQAEVKVLEEALHGMVLSWGKRKSREEGRRSKAFPAQTSAKGVPRGPKNRPRRKGSGSVPRVQEHG